MAADFPFTLSRPACLTLALAQLLLVVALEARAQTGATDQAIKYYQARVAQRPDDVNTYARLGQAYILKARETGDPQYYDLAEKTLTRGLALSPSRPSRSRPGAP